jgi:hypothetical protein
MKARCDVCHELANKTIPVIVCGVRYVWYCEDCYYGKNNIKKQVEIKEISRFELMDMED